ncbi:MAG: hypothetical protein AB1420_00810 [Bacillota bacterium]
MMNIGIKSIIPKINLPEKQKKLVMIALLILGLGMILISYSGFPQEKGIIVEKDESSSKENTLYHESAISQAEILLEQRLERILGKIDGVGKVSVSVSLKGSTEYEYAVNVSTVKKSIDENDQAGGSRLTLDTSETGQLVLLRNAGSVGEKPVVIKEIRPDIMGVLIVAEGAKNPLVKVELTRAVQTLLGLSANQVKVLSMEGR